MNLALFLNSFHQTVRTNRIALAMTQADLALKANVSVATIKRIESGESCGLKEFARIVSVLNPKLVDLIYQAMVFDPLDFTQDAEKGIQLVSIVKSKRRVRSTNE